MERAVPIIAAGVLALLSSAAITPVILLVSHRRAWFDIPNERKIHTSPIPRLGGIGIFWGLMIATLAVPLLAPVAFPGAWSTPYSLRFVPLFAGFCLLHAMGLVDDFHNLRARLKFIVQLAAATLVTVGGFTISTVRIPGLGTYSLGLFSYPITVLWIVAISNAINLVDGVDGLAGGISAFAALSLGLVSLVQGHPIPALFAFALLGAVIGFLAFNFPPARIFMGDSGSLLLGCVLASLPLLATPGETSISDLFAPATVLLIPILDTVSAVVRRVKGRRAILSPDKEHIHHKLLALGWKETSILAIVYGFCLCFGVAAFGSMFLARGAALALLGSVWVAALIAFAVLNSATRRSKLAAPDLQGRP